MDEQAIRTHLQEIKAALTRNAEEREILLNLEKGYEGWLQLYSPVKPPARTVKITIAAGGLGTNGTQAKPSLRQTIVQTIRDGRGTPVRAADILERARLLGVVSKAKKPLNAVDFAAWSLQHREGVP